MSQNVKEFHYTFNSYNLLEDSFHYQFGSFFITGSGPPWGTVGILVLGAPVSYRQGTGFPAMIGYQAKTFITDVPTQKMHRFWCILNNRSIFFNVNWCFTCLRKRR